MTKQQQIILEIIRNSMKHLNADEIYLLAKEKIPKIAVGTVYRNLQKFEEKSLIRRIPMDGEGDRFDKNIDEHGHAVCVSCGSVCDVFVDNLKETIKADSQIDVISMNLNIKYLCEDCKTC